MANSPGKHGIGKLFRNGRSQAVRLPQEFRFAGDRVRIRRVGRGVMLEPVISDVTEWFAAMDRFAEEPFMQGDERQKPAAAKRDIFE